jgi:ParB-like chromosome segregation protein Spo0J
MILIDLELSDLVISEDLSRSGSAKQFEERLKSSIEEIGLVEPIKVAPLPTGKYLVIDGTMRLKAIAALRKEDPAAFSTIPAYMMDYDRRYELRYQTDIYQDLLPSQLAELVEHLHQTEHVRKADIARYIGVSPVTLRNYTGLWRLLQRGGLFAKVVELMDVGVVPSSNPYAWLRLTAKGLRYVLEHDFQRYVMEDDFSDGETAESWIEQCVQDARRGKTIRIPIKFVEIATAGLPAEYYRQGEELRTVKRDLGLRRAGQPQLVQPELEPPELVQPELEPPEPVQPGPVHPELVQPEPVHSGPVHPELVQPKPVQPGPVQPGVVPEPTHAQPESDTADARDVIKYLSRISRHSLDPVLRTAAHSLQAYLQ